MTSTLDLDPLLGLNPQNPIRKRQRGMEKSFVDKETLSALLAQFGAAGEGGSEGKASDNRDVDRELLAMVRARACVCDLPAITMLYQRVFVSATRV